MRETWLRALVRLGSGFASSLVIEFTKPCPTKLGMAVVAASLAFASTTLAMRAYDRRRQRREMR